MAFSKRRILKSAQKYTHKRQWDKAVAEYEKLTQEDFGDTSLHNVIGDLYLNKGDIPRAIEYFNEAARYYEERGFAAKAIAVYKKVVRMDPSQAQNYERLSQLYADQGLTQEAVEQLDTLARQYERQSAIESALQTYFKITELDPTNIPIKVKIGEIYERQGVNDHAAEEFVKVAEAFMKKGDLGSAFHYFRKAYSLDADNCDALKGIASVFLNSDQTDKAVETLRLTVEKNPNDMQALFILGRTYLQDGDQDAALPVFERILELEPNQEGVKEIVGKMHLQRGNYEQAGAILENVVDRYLDEEAYESALKILQQMRQANPQDVQIRIRTAKIFLKMKMEARAHEEYEQIAQLFLDNNEARKALKVYEQLYLAQPGNQQYRKNYFELARELNVQPVFVEHDAQAVKRPPELDGEPAVGADLDVHNLDDSVDREFEAQVSTDRDRRPRSYRAQLSRDQKKKIDDYHSEADVFVKYGLHDNAISRLRDILDLDPLDMTANKKLRDMYRSQNRLPEFFQQAIAIAELYEQLDERDNALEAYQVILDENPDHLRALDRVRALTSDSLPQPEPQPDRTAGQEPQPQAEYSAPPAPPEAEDQLPVEVDAEPLQTYKVKDLATGSGTDVDVQEVIAEFRRGLNKRINPKDFETHYNLGIAYREMGLLDEAISEFRLVLNFPDMIIDGCANLGVCFMQIGDHEKAIKILEYGARKAVKEPMKALAMKYDLASAHEAAGNRTKALKLFQEIDSQKPNFRDAKRKIKHLQNRA